MWASLEGQVCRRDPHQVKERTHVEMCVTHKQGKLAACLYKVGFFFPTSWGLSCKGDVTGKMFTFLGVLSCPHHSLCSS